MARAPDAENLAQRLEIADFRRHLSRSLAQPVRRDSTHCVGQPLRKHGSLNYGRHVERDRLSRKLLDSVLHAVVRNDAPSEVRFFAYRYVFGAVNKAVANDQPLLQVSV